MANPQKENGAVPIANELWEALGRTYLSSYENQVLNCILRKTYGWNKKTDRISYSQFEEYTGIDRRHTARTLKRLLDRNIIICQGEGQNLEYGVQKDYERWQPLPKQATKPLPKQATVSTVAQIGNATIDTATGEIISETPEPLPKQATVGEKPLPKQATKPLPKQAHTKDIIHKTSSLDIYIDDDSLEEFLRETRGKYPDLDFDHELEKCRLWWDSRDAKHTPKNLKLCIVNWMDKAMEMKKERRNFKPRGDPDPDKYTRGKYGHVVQR